MSRGKPSISSTSSEAEPSSTWVSFSWAGRNISVNASSNVSAGGKSTCCSTRSKSTARASISCVMIFSTDLNSFPLPRKLRRNRRRIRQRESTARLSRKLRMVQVSLIVEAVSQAKGKGPGHVGGQTGVPRGLGPRSRRKSMLAARRKARRQARSEATHLPRGKFTPTGNHEENHRFLSQARFLTKRRRLDVHRHDRPWRCDDKRGRRNARNAAPRRPAACEGR